MKLKSKYERFMRTGSRIGKLTKFRTEREGKISVKPLSQGKKDGKAENKGKDAKNWKTPTPTGATAAATANVNKPASPSKDVAKSSSHDSSKLDALAAAEGEPAAETEPATV